MLQRRTVPVVLSRDASAPWRARPRPWAASWAVVLLATLLEGGRAWARGDPCIPEGFGAIDFDRPPLGEPGDPSGAEWAEGTGKPEAFEVDPLTPDDPMGPALPDDPPVTASVLIENNAGLLSGPNGAIQNGLLSGEGDSIEVKVQWTYRYKVQETVCKSFQVRIENSGPGTSICWTYEVWAEGTKCSETEVVCPC